MPEGQHSPLGKYMVISLVEVLDEFQHELYKKIILDYKAQLEQGKNPGSDYFTNHPDRDIQTLAIELLTFPFEYASWDDHDIPFQIQLHPDDNFKLDAMQAMLRLKWKMLMKQIAENQVLISKFEQEDNMEELIIHLTCTMIWSKCASRSLRNLKA